MKNDPRSPASEYDLRYQVDLQVKLYEGAREAWDGYQQVSSVRAILADILKVEPVAELADATTSFDSKLALIGGSGGGGRRFGGGFPPAGGTQPAPTFAGVMGAMIRHLGTLDSGDMAPNEVMIKNAKTALADLKTATANWKTLAEKDLAAFNIVLAKFKIKPIMDALR